MLLNPTQYSPQGWMPQFAGFQGAGVPQIGPGLFAQPGAYGGNGQMQYPQMQYPLGVQQYPAQQYPFFAGQQYPFAYNPLLASTGTNHLLAQHLAQTLAQLAHQNFAQSALTQQIGVTIQQLALLVQSLQPQQGMGTGQAFGLGGQAFGIGGTPFGQIQPFGQSPFAIPSQTGYAGIGTPAGFGPQPQPWGSNRPPTIQ